MRQTYGHRFRNSAPPEYKFRTREHVIADLSVNHVERPVLREGHVVERVVYDYGYDLLFSTFHNGRYESGQAYIQLKATDHLNGIEDGKTISLKLTRADVNLWLGATVPVFLILWAAVTDTAYWLYVQPYVSASGRFPLAPGKKTLTVRLSKENVLTQAVIARFREYKNIVHQQVGRVVVHRDWNRYFRTTH